MMLLTFLALALYSSALKTYSQGMEARLLFSMLTGSSHDCLAMDEGFFEVTLAFTKRRKNA